MWINHKDWYSDKEYKKAQDSWVRHYKNQLEKLRPWDYSEWRRRPVAEQIVFKYYREGRMYGRLQLMDFKQFAIRITESGYYYRSKRWKRDFTRDHYKYNRNGKRNPKNYSEKKVLSEKEIAKREWREFKQVRKDKSKTYPGRQPKPFCKRLRNRSYRNYVRNEMRKGRYEFGETLDSVTDIWWYD